MSTVPSPHLALGLAGFTFADLHVPERLAELHARFVEDVRAVEPELWTRWEAFATTPAALGPVERSTLLVALAPHVSRFVARLFSVGPEAMRLADATRAYDELFRFKIDFVRRRALPLLKGGERPVATADDHEFVSRLIAGARDDAEQESLLARAGCALLDREDAARISGDDHEKASVATDIEALRRWCAAHVHDPARKAWVVFRFPEALDFEHLVQVVRPDPARPFAMIGPESHRRRRDGFALTDVRVLHARGAQRSALLRPVP